MQCVVLGGELDPFIRRDINSFVGGDSLTAHQLHMAVVDIFNKHGYRTIIEYPAPYYRSDGFPVAGKLDILATKGSHTIAIEVDRRLPRAKSVAKLWQLRSQTCGQVVVLRRTTEEAAMYEDMWNHG